jgi:hypothetical protein
MSYLGQVELKSSEIRRVNVTGSTSATHTLTWTPPSEQSLIITINGIKQQNNYTISGVTLTLDTALIATDAMEVVGILDIGEAVTPPDDSISTVKIQDDAVTAAKLANSINTEIAANTAKTGITSGQASAITANTAKVTNATHTGDVTGATALTIATDAVDIAMLSATGVADATTFLRGDNAWASAGGDNTPSFAATMGTNQSITSATWTLLQFDTESWDTDSAFDATTNYRFTVPVGEGGKYLVLYGARMNSVGTGKQIYGAIYVNGVYTEITDTGNIGADGFEDNPRYTCSVVLDLAAGDYIDHRFVQNSGSSKNVEGGRSYFQAFKLIGV